VFLVLLVVLAAFVLAGPVTALSVTRPLWCRRYRSAERTGSLALLVVLVALGGVLVLAVIELLGWWVAMGIAHRDDTGVPSAETAAGLLAVALPGLCVAVLLVVTYAVRRYRALHMAAVVAPVAQVGAWLLLSQAAR
jgi:hypothetical protein